MTKMGTEWGHKIYIDLVQHNVLNSDYIINRNKNAT